MNIVDTLKGKDVEHIHYIWKKFHTNYQFDTNIADLAGKSYKTMIENYVEWDWSTVKTSIKNNVFQDYKEYFEMVIKGERHIILEDFKLKEGGLKMSLIHELVLHDNKDFLNFTLDLFK